MDNYSVAMVVASPFPANHGTPGSIREMSQALLSHGHKIHIVTYHIGDENPVEGIKIHRIKSIIKPKKIKVGPTWYKPFFDLLLVAKLCKVIKEENIDIIHAHNYEGALVGYFAKIITKTPMIYHAINNMASELPTFNFIKPKKLAMLLADFLDRLVPRLGGHIIALSEELKTFLLGKGIPEDKISVIPLGVDAEMFNGKSPEIIKNRYNIGPRPLVVYAGTLDEFQRIDLLMKAMKLVVGECNDAVLMVVSNILNQAEIEKYKKMAIDLGIDNNVIFTDVVSFDELPFFLASAAVAVVPRFSCPGFPLKILNYMAAGKAIVTFDGSAKGLKNMHNAIVVKNGELEEFAKGILLLIGDRKLAEKLGNNARATVKSEYGWQILAGKIDFIYRKVINSGRTDNNGA